MDGNGGKVGNGFEKAFVSPVELFARLAVYGRHHAQRYAAQFDRHVDQRLNQVVGLYLDGIAIFLTAGSQRPSTLNHLPGQRIFADGQPGAAQTGILNAAFRFQE